MDRYLNHVTLTTGHVRQSYRSEVSDEVVALCRDILSAARSHANRSAPIPHVEPSCTLRVTETAEGMLATVFGPERAPLVTIGCAHDEPGAVAVWQALLSSSTLPIASNVARPPVPWCVGRLEAGINFYLDAAVWLGDFERCLAWAWLEPG